MAPPTPGYKAPRMDDPDGLTPNLRTCLTMLQEGKTRSDVVDAMGVSRQRVAEMIKQLREKGHDVPDARGYTRRAPAKDGEASE